MQAGVHAINLVTRRGGLANFTHAVEVEYTGSITAVGDAATGDSKLPVGGGSTLAIQGTGFSLVCDDNAVTVGGEPCACVSATHARIECTTPHITQGVTAWGEALTAATVSVSVGLLGQVAAQTLQYTWDVTPKYASITPTAFSAAVTTNLAFVGDFGDFTHHQGQAACRHQFFLRSASGDRACAEVKINGTAGSCIMPRGEPAAVGEQHSMVPKLRLCAADGRAAFAVPEAGAPAAFDVALRVTRVLPMAGSFAGGTAVTITGAGFASEDEKQVLTGLTYQYEVGSNAITIRAGQKAIQCDITAASFGTLECTTRKYTAAKLASGVDEEDTHGHSGGGVNGRFVVEVNGYAALGMGVDPDAGHVADDLVSAGATSGIVVDPAVHSYFDDEVRHLDEGQALEERGIALAWIDVYRLKSELCVSDLLTEVAQALSLVPPGLRQDHG